MLLPPAKCVILVAAETKMATCEAEPVKTSQVNSVAPRKIAIWAESVGAKLIFLSSIAVFGDDLTGNAINPNTTYGRQKLKAEQEIARHSDNYVILRMGKVITERFELFERWIFDVSNGKVIQPFHDLYVSPVYESLVNKAVYNSYIKDKQKRILTLTAIDSWSYAEIADLIFKYFGFDKKFLRPTRSDRGEVLFRPKHMKGGVQRKFSELSLPAYDTETAVMEYLEKRAKSRT